MQNDFDLKWKNCTYHSKYSSNSVQAPYLVSTLPHTALAFYTTVP